ncbi:ABC transporter ATP-binding protein [Akkermansiaceae bacterium]|nr:ABC transporter ATP-binding protein [Akkermansiaceae bacterium]MDA7931637.1 ABC transporter ATP-binding protein [Akkermansiaceae bacterium]MDA7935314.1 ABC transporter ATP-binding protein [Akkermansiaceae bacterium]MDB4144098.1 ABC transporter ATP-binding protein [Akkermansiaceae bacterium]MDB4434147.1 ABC transporter ATP-binding protein [Akkermansiaceae bacterium]
MPDSSPVTEVIRIRKVEKTFEVGEVKVRALRGIDLTITQGEFVAIMGPSGSGKSTLLNILGCLDRPTTGEYFLGGEDVAQMDDDTLSAVRGKRLGFIFQSYNLIAQLTVLENIQVPLIYQQEDLEEHKERCIELGKLVGLDDRLDHRPNQLSGGQQQRVAIARSLVNEPLMILADEPTGNLDSQTEIEVLGIINDLNKQGRTIVLVTHDDIVSHHAHRVIHMKDGLIDREVINPSPGSAPPS